MITSISTDFRQLQDDYTIVAQAINYLDEQATHQPELGDVAAAVGLSEYHFQRLFTRWAGISPKRFLQFVTKENAKGLLNNSDNLLDTTYQVGLSSLGRLHDLFVTTEAVTPGQYKSRGSGITIRYGLHATPFGECLIATTQRGICHLSFVQDGEGDAIDRLVTDWRQARMVEDHDATASLVEPIFDLSRRSNAALRVHLRGTNFQIKVWEALLRIPAGKVTTYGQIARGIGQPTASRAVGSAVGRNPIAVLIPCHRVIRGLGEFGNYRYGATRKKALLAHEFAGMAS
ncbi:MAG TPA: bifunctional helix-turn-helix domain-containing protein/methylated-DNA--[protein]-cysteine S-methyltransferase [Anaerolineales bacterium]|nr:bifunctional helix-turn-helix domain-containing protein/methylated-DNA--[protein]-cysteine S-methyltransferase [Anaerolineales bacterium]